MTNEELKQALTSGREVVLTNEYGAEIEYSRVTAIVYRMKGGRISVSAELLDKCGRSVVLCDPQRIRAKGGADNV